MPIFAGKILQGGPRALGFLMGAIGTGALAGTIYLATRRNVVGLGRIIALSSGLFGAGLICFSLSRNLFLSILLMLPTGFGMILEITSTNTILQTLVDEEKRGRVMSFHMMAIMGMVPFGSLLSGTLASHIGAPSAVMISGISCILGSLIFTQKLKMLSLLTYPIYVRKGIIIGNSESTEKVTSHHPF